MLCRGFSKEQDFIVYSYLDMSKHTCIILYLYRFWLNNMSMPKTYCHGVAVIVRWEALIAHAKYSRISTHGYIWSKILLSRSLVKSIFNIIWYTRFTRALSWGLLTYVNTGLISDYFIKLVKFCLNSDPLSKTALHGLRYLHSHLLLKIWLILADDLSIYLSLPAVTS